MLGSSVPTPENVCPVTVTGIPMSAWTALDSVCTASGTQQESTVRNASMALSEIPSAVCPGFASPAPVHCPTWPILQLPAIGKVELFGVFAMKTMLDLTVKDVLLVTMETPY